MKFNSLHKIFAWGCFLACGVSAVTAQVPFNIGRNASVSIYIRDLKGDSVLYEYDSERALIPASVTKSVTTATALSLLGMDYRFATDVYLMGKPDRNGVWKGDLVIRPHGDPTLESKRFADFNGLCDSVALHLQRLGVREISGHVAVADTVEAQGQSPEWMNEDTVHPYGAGWYNLNWRDNVFTLWPASGRTEPFIPDLEIKNVRRRSPGIERGAGSERLYVYGNPRRNKGRRVVTTMPAPRKAFVHELIGVLDSAGIKVRNRGTGFVDDLDNADQKRTQVYTHYSAPLGDIMRDLMYRSDNMFAEGVLRSLVPDGSLNQAAEFESDFWKEQGVDMTGVKLVDGCGLSRINGFPARFLGDVLTQMARGPHAAEYVSLYPVAGVSGTVRSMMRDTPLEGRLVLKSGTMQGVRCYAGYALDDEGRPSHAIAVMANRFACSAATVRANIEKLLLYRLGKVAGEEPSDEDGESDEDITDGQ